MPDPTYRLTGNAQVAAMLDGIDELPCAFCDRPCAVPDYVLAVKQTGGRLRPIAVCQECSDTLVAVLPLFVQGLTNTIARGHHSEGDA